MSWRDDREKPSQVCLALSPLRGGFPTEPVIILRKLIELESAERAKNSSAL